MKPQTCIKESFCAIGKEGSTDEGNGFIQRVWNVRQMQKHRMAGQNGQFRALNTCRQNVTAPPFSGKCRTICKKKTSPWQARSMTSPVPKRAGIICFFPFANYNSPQKGTVRSRCLSCYLLLIQSMAVAIPIERPKSPKLHPGFRISLRIKFHHLDSICGYKRSKGNIMLLCHRVRNGNKMFVLHNLNIYCVITVSLLCLQSRQGDATAADQRISHAVDHISTEGTDIEFGPQHIGRNVLIDNMFSVHQLDNGDV